MYIQSIKYEELLPEKLDWFLSDTVFNDVNLIVGKNGTGKTRILNIMSCLAQVFTNKREPSNGHWEVTFWDSDTNSKLRYILTVLGAIQKEHLSVNGEVVLDRGKNGIGRLKYEKISTKDKMVEFKCGDKQSAVFFRGDEIQHPHVFALQKWGKSLRHYYFGSTFGHHDVKFHNSSGEGAPKEDDTSPDKV